MVCINTCREGRTDAVLFFCRYLNTINTAKKKPCRGACCGKPHALFAWTACMYVCFFFLSRFFFLFCPSSFCSCDLGCLHKLVYKFAACCACVVVVPAASPRCGCCACVCRFGFGCVCVCLLGGQFYLVRNVNVVCKASEARFFSLLPHCACLLRWLFFSHLHRLYIGCRVSFSKVSQDY